MLTLHCSIAVEYCVCGGEGGGGRGRGWGRGMGSPYPTYVHSVWATTCASIKIPEWLGMDIRIYVFILLEHQASVVQEIQVTWAGVNKTIPA